MDKISLFLVILGATNWGLMGIFNFDFIAYLFGGNDRILSRIIYSLIFLAGIWCISLLFRDREEVIHRDRKVLD